ncbi:ImmA/IrrE family metallo-endopeptidase [Leekyejoonella antrihumi]|uniref:ImmA/IrrE family metallo-endopeptidase n=1 Tax=Leekyejoonella antrihumi TaxID=1660198 RepID=A0A563DW91_9MICO|nr:ImmA/IrrE family metallo-endopeptidase [Leekyejoonella antrihumi]TWP34465.1 ImmA/IrrE family metallo-endopeptidase [Leekyejoonella antrihumi]
MRRRYSRTARRIAQHCPVPEPWDIAAFCTAIADNRHRPLQVIARPAMSDTITGLLVQLPDRDVIFYRNDLAGIHRDHVICHEIGHLLAGHLHDLTADHGDLAGAANIMLHRQCDYGDQREHEAEDIAELILTHVQHKEPPPAAPGFGAALG